MKNCVAFRNIDLFAVLEEIMNQNTAFYICDLDIDKEILKRAAKKSDKEDKVFLWISRPCGTNCYPERDVFLRGTVSHDAWLYHSEQSSDRILAYAVEVAEEKEGEVFGNLYELDYCEHCRRVKEKALKVDIVRMVYEKGELYEPIWKCLTCGANPELGKFERLEYVPNEPDAFLEILSEERKNREKMKEGDFQKHIDGLRRGLIEWEARRIEEELRKMAAAGEPKKEKPTVTASIPFLRIAEEDDIEQLISMLPWCDVSITIVDRWVARSLTDM